MHRQGADPRNMQPADFLCDFCLRPWDGSFPLVEGHKGSLICGRCLTVAFTELATAPEPTSKTHTCTLCLAEQSAPGWQSPATDAWICRTCTKRSAGYLHNDPDWDWKKPATSNTDTDESK